MRQRLLALLLAAAATAATADRPRVAPDRVIALLALPDLLGEQGCAPREPKAVRVFADPALARTIGRLRAAPTETDVDCAAPRASWHPDTRGASGAELPTEEFDYERPAAIVLETRAGAARIVLPERRSGWVAVAADEHLLGLERLYRDALSYLDHDWSGVLYAEPADRPSRRAVDPRWRHRIGRVNVVKVVRVRVLPDNTWIEIELGSAAGCADESEPLPQQQGWIPAYGRSGWPLVWFHSRGC